jgi:hypothetical protein
MIVSELREPNAFSASSSTLSHRERRHTESYLAVFGMTLLHASLWNRVYWYDLISPKGDRENRAPRRATDSLGLRHGKDSVASQLVQIASLDQQAELSLSSPAIGVAK